ncbi:GNAT family N-acetyltransferase [soil metagenome]
MVAAGVTIRDLRPDERPAWEPLWRGYLAFYKSPETAATTEMAWHRAHDPTEPMHIIGAFVDGELLGIAHYLFHRSFWTPGDYCYLQDLFVAEAARGKGLGRALIEEVTARAKTAGASRVHWLTQESNHTARALYETLADRSGFIQYRRLL